MPGPASIHCYFVSGGDLALFGALGYCTSRDLRDTLDSASMSTTKTTVEGQALHGPRHLKLGKSGNLFRVIQDLVHQLQAPRIEAPPKQVDPIHTGDLPADHQGPPGFCSLWHNQEGARLGSAP